MRAFVRVLFAAASVLSPLPGSGLAQEMPIPPSDQAVVFKKVLSYDRGLKRAPGMTVFIVGGEADHRVLQELFRSFREVQITPVLITQNESLELRVDHLAVTEEGGGEHVSEGWAARTAIIYLLPSADLVRLKQLCTEAGILSISGVPSLAQDGHVSVGVDKKESGQEIIVNLERLKAERHELSAELLRLARVIR